MNNEQLTCIPVFNAMLIDYSLNVTDQMLDSKLAATGDIGCFVNLKF